MLGITPLLTLLDSVAAGADVMSDAAAMIETAAIGNVSDAAAIPDASVQTELTPILNYRAQLLAEASILQTLQGGMLQRALDRHYGAAGGGDLNRFLSNNDSRVHPVLRLIGMQFDARNVFASTVVDPVATYEGTAAGTGSFATVIDVDSTLFGDSAFELVVDEMGDADRTVTLTFRTFAGASVDATVTIPANAATGEIVDVPGVMGVGIIAIVTTAGGEAGDTFHVRSLIEREIAL